MYPLPTPLRESSALPAPRRFSPARGPAFHLSFFLLLAVGACSRKPEPKRFATGVAAVGQEQAVLITWPKTGGGDRHVELVPATGRPLWSRPIPGLHVPDTLGHSGVVAAGERIVLYGERDGKIVVVGLDRDSGKTAWETPVGDAGNTRMGPMLIVDQDRILAIHPNNPWTRDIVTALLVQDGKILWKREDLTGTGPLSLTRLGPARLVGSYLGTPAFLLDGASGKIIRELPFNRPGRLTPLGYVGADGPVISLIHGDAKTPDFQFRLDGELRAQLEVCGLRGGELILAAYAHDGSQHYLLRVDPTTGATRWRQELGKNVTFPSRVIGDGRLPRALPLPVTIPGPKEGSILHRLVTVDLDAGRITSTVELREHYLFSVLHGGRAFFKSMTGDRLFFPDPETGALTRVLRLEGVTVQDLAGDDLAEDRLWFFGTAWARSADLPRATLNLTNGQLQTHGALRAEDVTAEGWPAKN